jgi:hypothetical protein
MIWRKASYSANGGASCVEVARVSGSRRIAARDSKHPTGPHIELSRRSFAQLLNEVKSGRLDLM